MFCRMTAITNEILLRHSFNILIGGGRSTMHAQDSTHTVARLIPHHNTKWVHDLPHLMTYNEYNESSVCETKVKPHVHVGSLPVLLPRYFFREKLVFETGQQQWWRQTRWRQHSRQWLAPVLRARRASQLPQTTLALQWRQRAPVVHRFDARTRRLRTAFSILIKFTYSRVSQHFEVQKTYMCIHVQCIMDSSIKGHDYFLYMYDYENILNDRWAWYCDAKRAKNTWVTQIFLWYQILKPL